MRVGRYCIIKYNEHTVKRLKSMARHIYSTKVVNGERVIYEFEHNPIPEEVLVTDKQIHITSSFDRMSWKVFNELLYIKDKSITL